MALKPWLAVGMGGGLGALIRYGAMILWPSSAVPWNILWINVSGSFLIGLLMALAVEQDRLGPTGRLFLTVGVLGGYTTFSTYVAGVFTLLQQGRLGDAAGYAAGSVILGVIGTWAGLVTARLWDRLRGSAAQDDSAGDTI